MLFANDLTQKVIAIKEYLINFLASLSYMLRGTNPVIQPHCNSNPKIILKSFENDSYLFWRNAVQLLVGVTFQKRTTDSPAVRVTSDRTTPLEKQFIYRFFVTSIDNVLRASYLGLNMIIGIRFEQSGYQT